MAREAVEGKQARTQRTQNKFESFDFIEQKQKRWDENTRIQGIAPPKKQISFFKLYFGTPTSLHTEVQENSLKLLFIWFDDFNSILVVTRGTRTVAWSFFSKI